MFDLKPKLSVSFPNFFINHACNPCWQVSSKAHHQLPLILALGRLLALLMKAHHKLALVLGRKRGKGRAFSPWFDQPCRHTKTKAASWVGCGLGR
jgi:hypothetical protein